MEHVIEDIETLNQRALQGELEVTAVSCHAYAYLADRYLVMRSGASVGDQYGPILVADPKRDQVPFGKKGPGPFCTRNDVDICGKRIAVPGKLTTAYLALLLYQANFEPVFTPFDKILEAVQLGKVDLGLVIHEGQITYQDQGLQKILDLGRWWHEETSLPLPLGVDVIRRDLGAETIRSFAKLFKQSIEYALAHRKEALAYALDFGRGISEKLGDRFVGMYVNHYTVDLGSKGEKGLAQLFDTAYRKGLLPHPVRLEFA